MAGNDPFVPPADEKPYQVIGIIDNYGAIHCEKLYISNRNNPQHETLWPGKHKRWRFHVSDWDLSKSILSDEAITHEDYVQIEAHMRKILPLPNWVEKGDAWEAAGRPHGAEGIKFERNWDRKMKRRKAKQNLPTK